MNEPNEPKENQEKLKKDEIAELLSDAAEGGALEHKLAAAALRIALDTSATLKLLLDVMRTKGRKRR